MKRQTKAAEREKAEKAKQPASVAVVMPMPQQDAPIRSTLLDKPWDETQAMLKDDLSRLRTLAGSQEKEPYKQELLKKYQPLVERLLTTHSNLKGLDVVWWFYQWSVDIGNLTKVYESFRAAIDMGLETPERWKSNGQTAFCDIVFKYSNNAHTNKAEFNREYLQKIVLDVLAGDLAINAPLKVKMFRLVGDWHHEKGENEKAYIMFEQVMSLDPAKGGRKTKLNELKQELGYDAPNQG